MIRARDGTGYDRTGPQDAPVVVLIHGLGLNRALWQVATPTLTGFRAANSDRMDLVRRWVLANDPATYPLYHRIFAEDVAPSPIPDRRSPARPLPHDAGSGTRRH